MQIQGFPGKRSASRESRRCNDRLGQARWPTLSARRLVGSSVSRGLRASQLRQFSPGSPSKGFPRRGGCREPIFYPMTRPDLHFSAPATEAGGVSDDQLLMGLFGQAGAVESIGGAAVDEVGGELWQHVRKRGHLLLLAKAGRGGIAQGIRFYRAQRHGARVFRALHRIVSASPLWPLVPAELRAGGGLVGVIEADGKSEVRAILFGNPEPSHRRAILQVVRANGSREMVKAGFCPESMAAVEREAEFLRHYGGSVAGVPELREDLSDRRWRAISCAEVPGKPAGAPNRWLKGGLELLAGWEIQDDSCLLQTWSAWPQCLAAAQAMEFSENQIEVLGKLGNAQVRRAYMHGDFAPWNLLVEGSAVRAIDWEWASADGLAGLDLVHAWYQWNAMVRKVPAGRLLVRTLRDLEGPRTREALLASGWPTPASALLVHALRLNPIYSAPTAQAVRNLSAEAIEA